MARQEVSRTTHIEEGELRVTHENAILTNITDVPTKIFASSSREDQKQADEPHSQPHRKEIPIQRPNQLYRQTHSEDFTKFGFTSTHK